LIDLPLSELKFHFILSVGGSYRDLVFMDEHGKQDFVDALIQDFKRVKLFNQEGSNPSELFSLDFDHGRSEVRVAFKYDHHAFSFVESTGGDISKLRVPREVQGTQIGNVFNTYI
jgi:hypothetical protein